VSFILKYSLITLNLDAPVDDFWDLHPAEYETFFFCEISFIHFVLVEEAQMNIARHMELDLPRLHCLIPNNDGKGTVQKNVLSIFFGS